MIRAIFTAALSALLCTAQGLDGFDVFVDAQLKEWKVPGAAIAVVRDGKVIHAKGYGLRNIKEKLPVTTQTLFAIGSSTKAMTVATLATLVDDGKLEWDKPVRDYLPDFRMHDEMATQRITPRDLVTHRSGLPRHDRMWYSAPFSRQQIYERLRYLELSKDLRTIFQYNNLMFLTAGVLAGRRLGSTWEDAVQARMFRPLGMASSNMSVEDSRRSADFALPYKQKDEQPQEVPFRNIDAIGPAGSVNSNAEDMARWLMLNLGKGKFEGKQVLSENQVEQMQTTQMPIAGQGRREELGPASYGMGWFLTTYRGRKLVHHGGNIDGFSALVTFMPRERLGLVILTNMNGSPMPTVVSYNGFDRLLGLDPIDWTGRLRDDEKKQKAAEAEAKAKNYTPRREGTRTSHELAAYAGRYEHPGYGAVDVAVEGSGLRVGIHSLSSEFKHFHYDVFQASEDPLNPISQQKLQFWTSLDGDIASLALPLEPSLGEIVFRRAASGQARSKAFLEPMTGDYVIGPVTATVAMRGDDTLTLFVPGQPKYELVPLDGTRFRLKEVNGFSVEFKKSEAGYAEVVFYQPNGTFVAKRKQN